MSEQRSADETEWKHDAVSELADLARQHVDERKEKASSGTKSKVFDTAHSVIDKVEEKLKQKA